MKNKFILGFLLGTFLFLVGMVSANISGYIVSGKAISDGGYTATLQKVDKKGVATVSVETPEGDIFIVQMREGQTAKVGGAEIKAIDLKRGTLFTRSGVNFGLNISNISADTGAGPCA